MMKCLKMPTKLQCTLDNPLSPTIVTLSLPTIEFNKGSNDLNLNEERDITIEIKRDEEVIYSTPKKESLKFYPSQRLLELEDEKSGLVFKIGLKSDGMVNCVDAQWSH